MTTGGAFVSERDDGPVRWITMSNPGRANAVPLTGWAELQAALERFQASEARVLVFTGAGGDFCAGADLTPDGGLEHRQDVARNHELLTETSRTALTLHRLGKPTIAAVDGLAIGAGMNLAIGCDLTVASTQARFAEIFVRRGLGMDMGGTWLLPRLVGLARAREIALTGRVLEADEALAIGLITHVVDPSDLSAAAADLAAELAAGAPLAIRAIKTGLDRSGGLTFEQALAVENQAQAMLLASADAGEGISSFLEQRSAVFGGS